MKRRFYFIIATALLIFISVNYYIGEQFFVFVSFLLKLHHVYIFWICYWIIAFSYLISRLCSRFLPKSLTQLLKIIGSYWIAVMLYSIILLPLIDLLGWVLHLALFDESTYIPLLGYLVLMILIILMIRGVRNARYPIVRNYGIAISKSAGQMKQLKIAVASDLHLGSIVGNKQLHVLVETIKQMKPDLILLPGDIIDDDLEPFIRQGMGAIMKGLKAPLGTYAILGNHEYIGGKIQEFVKQMKDINIEVLMDSSVFIAGSIYIIGRKDISAERFRWGGRADLTKLLEEVDPSFPLILMDHQPVQLDVAAVNGIDIQLSGHTHRGQMAPLHWITRRIFELDWGYLQKGNMHTIVSSGYGTWGPPIRLGSRSEIIELIVNFTAD